MKKIIFLFVTFVVVGGSHTIGDENLDCDLCFQKGFRYIRDKFRFRCVPRVIASMKARSVYRKEDCAKLKMELGGTLAESTVALSDGSSGTARSIITDSQFEGSQWNTQFTTPRPLIFSSKKMENQSVSMVRSTPAVVPIPIPVTKETEKTSPTLGNPQETRWATTVIPVLAKIVPPIGINWRPTEKDTFNLTKSAFSPTDFPIPIPSMSQKLLKLAPTVPIPVMTPLGTASAPFLATIPTPAEITWHPKKNKVDTDRSNTSIPVSINSLVVPGITPPTFHSANDTVESNCTFGSKPNVPGFQLLILNGYIFLNGKNTFFKNEHTSYRFVTRLVRNFCWNVVHMERYVKAERLRGLELKYFEQILNNNPMYNFSKECRLLRQRHF